jgi:hypothetical protein
MHDSIAAEESSAAATASITETFKRISFFSGPIDAPEMESDTVEHAVCQIHFELSHANSYSLDIPCATTSRRSGGQSSDEGCGTVPGCIG